MKNPDSLDRETFETLLDWLASDRESAGEKYEQIRHSLIQILNYHHPTAVASVPSGYLLVGGGARANGSLQLGLLLTASNPSSFHEWMASAKDHHFSESSTVTAFAIGIQQSIPGFGVLNAAYNSAPHQVKT